MGASTMNPFESFWETKGPVPVLTTVDPSTTYSADITNQATKTLLVKNTGTIALSYTVLASLDMGVAYDITLQGATSVAANSQSLFKFTDHYTNIQVQMTAAGAGAIGTIKFSASGN